MTIGSKEYNAMVTDHLKGKQWLNDVEVEAPDGFNDLDPLTALRYYDRLDHLTIDDFASIAAQMTLNKCIMYKRKNELLTTVVYTGGDLGSSYTGYPYLLDLLFKLCVGILLKKLTPPSDVSENGGKQ